MKKIAVLSLIVVCLFALFSTGYLADTDNTNYYNESAKLQKSPLETYGMFVDKYLSDKKNDEDYPDWYGGCYIDNSRLNIKIVEGHEAMIDHIKKSIKSPAVYEITDISLRRLYRIYTKLFTSDYSNQIVSVRLSQKDSWIYVTLITDSPKNDEIIKSFSAIDAHISFLYGGAAIPFA